MAQGPTFMACRKCGMKHLGDICPIHREYQVWIENPFSVSRAYAEYRGHRFMTDDAKEYAGEWKLKPIKKPMDPEDVKRIVNERVIKRGKNKGRIEYFLEGRCGRTFRAFHVPQFPEKTKVVIEALARWPDEKYQRDMSNLQKLTEDAFQNGKFIPNDSYLLWRNMDFKTDPGVYGLHLTIYPLEVK